MFLAATVFISFLKLILYCAAWKYNTVGMTAVMSYLNIPFGYFLDWLFFSRYIGTLELTGASLIFGSNVTIVMLRLKKWIN